MKYPIGTRLENVTTSTGRTIGLKGYIMSETTEGENQYVNILWDNHKTTEMWFTNRIGTDFIVVKRKQIVII